MARPHKQATGGQIHLTGRNLERDEVHIGGDPPAEDWQSKEGGEGEKGQKRRTEIGNNTQVLQWGQGSSVSVKHGVIDLFSTVSLV